jgi:hypothetical protein
MVSDELKAADKVIIFADERQIKKIEIPNLNFNKFVSECDILKAEVSR